MNDPAKRLYLALTGRILIERSTLDKIKLPLADFGVATLDGIRENGQNYDLASCMCQLLGLDAGYYCCKISDWHL